MTVERERRHRVLVELGRGGMATAYLALKLGPSSFRKLVVIKRMNPDVSRDEQFVRMFSEEARLAAQLQHPNIVDTHEVGLDGQHQYLSMEYIDGISLYAILKRACLPAPMLLSIFIDVLAGLEYAYTAVDVDGVPLKVVHRDISPQNVMVTYPGQAKILDFGIAKAASSASHTTTGHVKGKLAYMAPEQAAGLAVDGRTDIFAVGVMLWEAFARKRFYGEMPSSAIFATLLRGEYAPPLTTLGTGIERVADIVARATAASPDQRYPTAEAMREDLYSLLESMPDRRETRELGARLSVEFAEQRQERKAAVDDALRRLESDTNPVLTSGAVPAVSVSVSADPRQRAGSATEIVILDDLNQDKTMSLSQISNMVSASTAGGTIGARQWPRAAVAGGALVLLCAIGAYAAGSRATPAIADASPVAAAPHVPVELDAPAPLSMAVSSLPAKAAPSSGPADSSISLAARGGLPNAASLPVHAAAVVAPKPSVSSEPPRLPVDAPTSSKTTPRVKLDNDDPW